MAQPLFKDIGKRVSDLLTKEFPSDKREQKAEWKSTTPHGVKLEFSVKKEEGRDGSKTTGLIKNEYFYKPWATTFVGEINTDREAKIEASTTDKFIAGSKVIVTAQSQNKKGSLEYFATIAEEYRHNKASVAVSGEVGRPTDNSIKASFVVGSNGVSVGASAEYLRKETATDLKELKSTIGYAWEEFDVYAFGKIAQAGQRRTTEVGANYFHRLNADFQVGSEIKFDVTNKDSDKKPTLTFAGAYKLNPDTTVKARFDTEGKVGLSYAQQLNKTAKLLIAATIDSNEPSGKNGTALGFTLSLNA